MRVQAKGSTFADASVWVYAGAGTSSTGSGLQVQVQAKVIAWVLTSAQANAIAHILARNV